MDHKSAQNSERNQCENQTNRHILGLVLQLFDNSWNFLARNLIHKAEHPCSEWLSESGGEIGGEKRVKILKK